MQLPDSGCPSFGMASVSDTRPAEKEPGRRNCKLQKIPEEAEKKDALLSTDHAILEALWRGGW